MSPPGTTTPRRSGTLASTPVSITPTVTPAPSVTGHTCCGTCQSGSHHSSGLGVYWLACPVTRAVAAAGIHRAEATASPTATSPRTGLVTCIHHRHSPGHAWPTAAT